MLEEAHVVLRQDLIMSTLVADHSGKALEVANFAGHNGANVQQWDAHGNRTQRWRFEAV